MTTPHKHSALIKAWADGAEIEFYSKNLADWILVTNPNWYREGAYRIKPEPKPDVLAKVYVYTDVYGMITIISDSVHSNMQFTFDGETGKLKSVEMI